MPLTPSSARGSISYPAADGKPEVAQIGRAVELHGDCSGGAGGDEQADRGAVLCDHFARCVPAPALCEIHLSWMK
jgi:hypothetical protein